MAAAAAAGYILSETMETAAHSLSFLCDVSHPSPQQWTCNPGENFKKAYTKLHYSFRNTLLSLDADYIATSVQHCMNVGLHILNIFCAEKKKINGKNESKPQQQHIICMIQMSNSCMRFVTNNIGNIQQ